MPSDMYGLYIHIPFCRERCLYCDFYSEACGKKSYDLKEQSQHYISHLCEELRWLYEAGLLDDCKTVYIGGGTPSVLGTGLLPLLQTLSDLLPKNLLEWSVEANPESLNLSFQDMLLTAGVTRVSVGVQSFHDEELARLGRLHTAEEAYRRIIQLLEKKFRVSLDLMCAVPGQTEVSWRETLTTTAELAKNGLSHVSVYPLTLEPGTALYRRYAKLEPQWNSEDMQATTMRSAEKFLTKAGFSRYEVANYAKPGEKSLHNLCYWQAKSYIGLGSSAASMLTREEYERLRCMESLHVSQSPVCSKPRTSLESNKLSESRKLPVPGKLPVRGKLPELESKAVRVRMSIQDSRICYEQASCFADHHFELDQIDLREAWAEDLMLRARLSRGIPLHMLEEASAILGAARVETCVHHLVAQGLMQRAGDCQEPSLCPTERGWLLGNEVFQQLMALADD